VISSYEKLVLASVCKAVNISKCGHVPKQYFMKKFQNDKREKKKAEKAFRSLLARGYVSPHPTRGEMTYHLTAAGLDVCREIFKKWQKLLAEADEVRERTKDLGISASELIREDRDAR
jgi:hypothetical protein